MYYLLTPTNSTEALFYLVDTETLEASKNFSSSIIEAISHFKENKVHYPQHNAFKLIKDPTYDFPQKVLYSFESIENFEENYPELKL